MKNISEQDLEKELIALTKQLLAESGESPTRAVQMTSSLQRHLGIDSLGRAELFQRIEKKFQVSVPDRLLMEAETLADIAKFLQTAKPSLVTTNPKQTIHSHGERPNVNPAKAKSLTDILYLYADNSLDKPHIYFQHEDGQEEIITYGDLLKNSLRVAQGLVVRGLKQGETVAIMQPTHPGFFYTFFGTLLAGGIPVPIYPPFRMHMLEAYAKTEAHILKNAEVRILVTFEQAEKLSHLLQSFVPSLKHVTNVSELIRTEELSSPFKAQADNYAFIQYTSGSTADPKGVLLTHANLLTNIRAYGEAIKVSSNDVAVSWLPLYHDMGLIAMWLGSLYYGVPLVLMTPFSFLNHPERWLWAIHYHRGTVSGAPNFAYELCVRKIDPAKLEGLDLSSWRLAANGAEKVYPSTLEQFAKKFAAYGFKQTALLPVYGLAESTVALAIPPVGRGFRLDHVLRKPFEEESRAVTTTANDETTMTFVSSGPVLPQHDIRIVDVLQNALPERHVGSLQFRGPSSMQGYYNNPRATAAIYHDGWFDSGDLAYVADGEIYITGRRKDLIIKAGRNLYPVEIEELVGGVSGVRQGCVVAFGATHPVRATEELVIVAETRERDKSKHATITAAINDMIATTLDIVPDAVILVSPHTVPKTSSGKLQRAACKKMYLEGKLGKRHLPTWLQIAKLGTQGAFHKIINGLSKLIRGVYTVYAVLLVILSLLPMYLLACFAARDTLARMCRVWAKLYLTIIGCPIRFIDAHKLPARQTVIYVANHASYIDALVMLAIVPSDTRFIGKKELLTTPILKKFFRQLDYVPVDRIDLSKGIEDTKHMETVLRAGHSIVIFPEGTFGYAFGLRPFRLGAFKVAAETQHPICPIAVKGTRLVLRDEEKLLRPGVITVTVCDLLQPQSNEWQEVMQLRNAVRNEIAKYCGEPSLDYIAAQSIAPVRDN